MQVPTTDEMSVTDADAQYEVVVGGEPAGLTAALYTTRLGHDTAILDRGGGRCATMQDTYSESLREQSTWT